MNETKLTEIAGWLAENTDDYNDYFADMETYLWDYPISEREEWMYNYIVTEWGFESMLDVFFGEDPMVSDDGFEGMEQAIIKSCERFIQERAECGFSRGDSFHRAMSDKPEWFIQDFARYELEYEEQRGTETEYAKFLLEIVEEEE